MDDDDDDDYDDDDDDDDNDDDQRKENIGGFARARVFVLTLVFFCARANPRQTKKHLDYNDNLKKGHLEAPAGNGSEAKNPFPSAV